jgi:hypothetical protein
MRPTLRPGLRACTVDGTAMLADATSVVPLSPVAAALVAALDGVRDADAVISSVDAVGTTVRTAWNSLVDRRIVVDLDGHLQRVTALAEVRGYVSAPDMLGDLLAAPDGGQRWGARRDAVVDVRGNGPSARGLCTALSEAGVTCHVPRQAGRGDLVVLAVDREPDAIEADALMRSDQAHLVGGLRDTTAVVGPLVVPGATACLRCHDLTRGRADPTWRWRRPLLSQPAAHPVVATSASEPLRLATVALLCAEVLAFVERRPARTLTSVLTLTSDDIVPVVSTLEPQPWCGCVWNMDKDHSPPSIG